MYLFRKLGDGLFLNCCKEVSKDFPDIEFNDMIIDNASMQVSQGSLELSGRVFDSRLRGRGFEPHQRHCMVVLEQDTFILA